MLRRGKEKEREAAYRMVFEKAGECCVKEKEKGEDG